MLKTIPGLSAAKLIGGLVALLTLGALVTMINGWRVERNHLREWQSAVLTATRDASANPKLNKRDVAQQIHLLGQAVLSLKLAIIDQNAAVNALADASAKARQEAEKAVSAAKERVKAAQSTADRLAKSAGDPARKKAPCEASDALKGAWR